MSVRVPIHINTPWGTPPPTQEVGEWGGQPTRGKEGGGDKTKYFTTYSCAWEVQGQAVEQGGGDIKRKQKQNKIWGDNRVDLIFGIDNDDDTHGERAERGFVRSTESWGPIPP